MKIVVKGRDFDELTEAALPYVEKHPHLAERRRWWVDDAPEGGLMAIADSDPPRPLTLLDLPPRERRVPRDASGSRSRRNPYWLRRRKNQRASFRTRC
jgi:hypothetical protein